MSIEYNDYMNAARGIHTKKLLALFGVSVLCAEFKEGKVFINAIG